MRTTWSLASLVVLLTASSGCHAAPPPCLDLDQGKLSPKLRWLQTERLRGALMHQAFVGPFPNRYLRPAGGGSRKALTAPLTLRGQHVLLLPARSGQPVAVDLKALDGRPEFSDTVYALYSPSSRLVSAGSVARGKTRKLKVVKPETGDYVLLLNPSVAFDNAMQVSVSDGLYSIDGTGRQAFHSSGETASGTPLQMHILRDMKLAGMNVLMLDVRHLPFASDTDLKDWTRRLNEWGDSAAQFKMRFIPALDLGGSPAEVEGWGDSPPGLYIELHQGDPIAPCPLQKKFWDQILLRRGREVARASLKNTAVAGIGIDPEMYSCWYYGHYMLSGTCFCDHCMGGFLKAQGLSEDVLANMPTARERWQWIQSQKLAQSWDKYLEDETCRIATEARQEIQAINPDLFFVVYVLEIGNWFCRGLARGLGTERVPVINFAEGTYWVGYGDWAPKTVALFRSWGAHALHGGGLYPGSHPPTKPGYLGAAVYNFAMQTGGYWLWPMDYFLSDWQSRHRYEGQPAQQADYWLTLHQANAAIDERMRGSAARPCEYDSLTPHPVWNPEAKQKPEGVEWKYDPSYPLRLAGEAKLYFGVSKRAQRFVISAWAPGVNNGAQVSVVDPNGRERASVKGERDQPAPMAISEEVEPGIWCLQVKAINSTPLRDVRLQVEGLQPYFSPAPDGVLMPVEKVSSLVGWWKFDEGHGASVADSSGPPPANGSISGARWTDGHTGKALSFAGSGESVSIPHRNAMDHLSEFTVTAWVKLNALPTPGNGGTIVNKGPEAPVQHFWLWIGYPPNHSLILEMGNQKYQYGFGFSSGKLTWEVGRWYHLAAAFSCEGGTSKASLYRDRVLLAESTQKDVFDSGGYDLRVGSYGGAHTLNGVIDEVKVFDRALGPEAVQREATIATQ